MSTAENILSMPLEELRERVGLAERMALAARLTPSGTYAADSAPVNTATAAVETPAETTARRSRRTKEQIAADELAAKAKADAEKAAAATTGPSDAELMASMATDATADAGGLSLDDIGTAGGDMMEGFELEVTTPTPAEARKEAEAIVADIIAKKDTTRLAVAREALVKVGVQKASDVPDDKIVEFLSLLPKS